MEKEYKNIRSNSFFRDLLATIIRLKTLKNKSNQYLVIFNTIAYAWPLDSNGLSVVL